MTLLASLFAATTAAAEPEMCVSGAPRMLSPETHDVWQSLASLDHTEDAALASARTALVADVAGVAPGAHVSAQEAPVAVLWCMASDSRPECSERGAGHSPPQLSASLAGLHHTEEHLHRCPAQLVPLPRTPYTGVPAQGARTPLRRPPR